MERLAKRDTGVHARRSDAQPRAPIRQLDTGRLAFSGRGPLKGQRVQNQATGE
jgi:hypothetical protein